MQARPEPDGSRPAHQFAGVLGAVPPRPHGIHPRPVERPDGQCHILTTNNLFTCQRAAFGNRPKSPTLVPQQTRVSISKSAILRVPPGSGERKSRRFAGLPARGRKHNPARSAVARTAAAWQPIVTSTSARAHQRAQQVLFIARFEPLSSWSSKKITADGHPKKEIALTNAKYATYIDSGYRDTAARNTRHRAADWVYPWSAASWSWRRTGVAGR